MNNMNINYKDVINSFLLNKFLHHVGISWIFETNEQIKYDMDKYDPDCITGGTWYNTSICKNYMEQYVNNLL